MTLDSRWVPAAARHLPPLPPGGAAPSRIGALGGSARARLSLAGAARQGPRRRFLTGRGAAAALCRAGAASRGAASRAAASRAARHERGERRRAQGTGHRQRAQGTGTGHRAQPPEPPGAPLLAAAFPLEGRPGGTRCRQGWGPGVALPYLPEELAGLEPSLRRVGSLTDAGSVKPCLLASRSPKCVCFFKGRAEGISCPLKHHAHQGGTIWVFFQRKFLTISCAEGKNP